MRSEPLWTETKMPGSAHLAPNGRNGALDIWQLRNIEWLREVSAGELQDLHRSASHRRYAAGDQIFAPTATPHSVFLLESGLARIYRISESGCETSLGYIAAGEMFGEMTAFGDYPRESFAQAASPAGVWRVGRDAFQRLLASRPGLVIPITRQISARLKRVEARVEDLVVRSVRARVARMVLELAETFGHAEGDHIVVGVPLTQGELATLVGATRQTVNQVLGELTDEGLLGHDRRRIVLFDRDRLTKAASSVEQA